ncbi:MAG: HAD family hydrolase [Candidatus Omnitrophica bacterium]|nr:HAD family hydrolase [Candidatus Omnitrophota bacterium]MBU1923226.1 HAD family hydrolase [Candidatus Omnitrophota bacterium]
MSPRDTLSFGSVSDPTVFLDRDGVINRYPGDRLYVTSLKKFRFLPRAKKAIALLSKAGFRIFVASNQAGVGKGTYSQRTLDAITAKMLKDIEQAGGEITKVYYCTHRKELGCSCRKPKPGLLKKAGREFKVNLKKTYFLGDTMRDVLTAHAVGAKSILILCGKEKLSNQRNWEAKPDFVFKDLLAAAKFLTR